jgi:hypothetical protein
MLENCIKSLQTVAFRTDNSRILENVGETPKQIENLVKFESCNVIVRIFQ